MEERKRERENGTQSVRVRLVHMNDERRTDFAVGLSGMTNALASATIAPDQHAAAIKLFKHIHETARQMIDVVEGHDGPTVEIDIDLVRRFMQTMATFEKTFERVTK